MHGFVWISAREFRHDVPDMTLYQADIIFDVDCPGVLY